jgi:putative endonuclease
MYCVYILQSEKNGRFYIGHTNNLERRLQQHNAGQVKATAYMRPWRAVYTEPFDDGRLARKREWWLKAQKSRRFLEELVGGV